MPRATALEIINKHYSAQPEAKAILLAHSGAVAAKALAIARNLPHLNPDIRFIEEAALLHDIGIIHTNAPHLSCHGDKPYICHGVIGRRMLEDEGLTLHALVCERHVGVGLTAEDIRLNGFPIPERDMLPLSIEEKIVCYADKFFSKGTKHSEIPLDEVRDSMARYGKDQLKKFDALTSLLMPSQK